MSLPALTSPGASYRGAWRAQDAVLENVDQPVGVPSLVGSGADMLARYAVFDGSWSMLTGASAFTTYSATGVIDSGPTISSTGVAGFFTDSAAVRATAEGAGRKFTMFIRGSWSYGNRFSGATGFEHWVENQCCYLENGDDGAPAAQTQLDRGQSRRQQGTATFSTATKTFEVQCDSDANMSCYIDDNVSPENVFSFAAPQDEWSAYMIGPVQRTAGGIWTYDTNVFRWSRACLVSCDAGFLNSQDRENVRLWLAGTDFPPAEQGMNVLFWMCA